MNSQMNDFVGNILRNNFTPMVTTCYQVHAHLSAALVCYIDATGAETLMLLFQVSVYSLSTNIYY